MDVAVDKVYDLEAGADEVVGLPGEGLDHQEVGEIQDERVAVIPEQLVAERPTASRKTAKSNVPLYAGVGVAALLLAGGYVFLRPVRSHHVAPPMLAIAPLRQPIAPLAPAAILASVPVSHLPPLVVHQKYIPQADTAQLAELESLQTAAHPPASQSAISAGEIAGPQGAAPQAPAAVHPLVASPGSEHGQGASGGLLAAQAPSPAHYPLNGAALPSPLPGSPSAVSGSAVKSIAVIPAASVPGPGSLRSGTIKAASGTMLLPAPGAAAPMVTAAAVPAGQESALSPAQQTDLFQLVTQLGALVRTEEVRQAVLAAQVQQLSVLTSSDLADYNRRLSMLEAETSVSGAAQAASSTGAVVPAISGAPALAASQAHGPLAAPNASAPSSSPALNAATLAAVPSSAPAVVAQYHVQAASPGLAMLSVVGGSGAPLEVQTGDTIPGWGRVLAVVQQGDSWIVQTSSGNID